MHAAVTSGGVTQGVGVLCAGISVYTLTDVAMRGMVIPFWSLSLGYGGLRLVGVYILHSCTVPQI